MKILQHILLSILALATATAVQAQDDTMRVLRVHQEGQVVFQTPTSWMDSIKNDKAGYLTFYYSDATWSRSVASIDSVTFAMTSSSDTAIIRDTVAVDTTRMIRIVWNGAQAYVSNPYSNDSIQLITSGSHVTVRSLSTTLHNVVYSLSGSSTDGSLLFEKLSTPAILRLNGLTLQSVGQPAISIDKNQPVTIHTCIGKISTLSDADSNRGKATIYSKGSLSFQGQGHVFVTSDYANGIQGKRGVTVNSSTISVTVTSDASKGIKTDGHYIQNGGRISILASGSAVIDTSSSYPTGYNVTYCTGIKAGDSEEGTRGDICINGGNLLVSCIATNQGGRCLSSDNDFLMNGGSTLLTTAGDGQCLGGTGTSAIDGYSSTCIKADNVRLREGTLNARSRGLGGRGLVADGSLTVGEPHVDDSRLHVYVQTSGDAINPVNTDHPGRGHSSSESEPDLFKGLPKGIRADGNITINSGFLGSYCAQSSGDPTGEAIESKDSIFINGGTIEANAYDDAVNAGSYIEINGGRVWAYSRGNDGIDCNGNTNVLGGLLILRGAELGFDAATDAGGRFYVDGGTILTIGGTMGAWDNPNVAGSQKYITLNNSGNDGICVKDADSNVVLMFRYTTPSGNGFSENYSDPGAKPPPPGGEDSRAPMVFSSPDITDGNYRYWTTCTFGGGTSWHGLYTGSTPAPQGNAATVHAR